MSSSVRHAATEPQADVTESRVQTYRAAVVREFGADIHGDWPVKPSPPFVPGHEGVGVVVAPSRGARWS